MEGNKKMNKTWNLKEMKKLIPLALPVLVVNLSIVGMGAVDAIVAGRAGVTDMAAVALGSSVYLPVALFACGVLMIIGPVIANMRGKSHESRVGYMTNHGLWLAFMLSLVSMPVIYVLRNVFGWISDDAAMCQMASAYMFAIMWGASRQPGLRGPEEPERRLQHDTSRHVRGIVRPVAQHSPELHVRLRHVRFSPHGRSGVRRGHGSHFLH